MRGLLSCVLLVAIGCGTSPTPGASPDDVRLTVEPEAVAAGDSVTLVLTNGSSGEIGYNLCTSDLERRRDGGWEPVPSDRVCTMELRLLPPGDDARYSLAIRSDLPRGEYRYRTDVTRQEDGGPVDVASEAFRVER